MKWFRNWFRRKPAGGPPAPRPSFRPGVETLEGRTVPTISHTFLGGSQVATLIAYNNGVLYEFAPTFAGVVNTHVASAHAYRDPRGRLGMDVVFDNGTAYQIDSNGARFLGTGVREASTTYAASGSFLTLVAEKNGTVFALTNGGVSVLGTHFAAASTYLDPRGSFGYLLNYRTGGNRTLLVQIDSTTNRVIGPGYKGAEANFGSRGRFYLDLTRDNGDTIELSPSGAHLLGNSF